MRETFADWYFERTSGKTKEIDCTDWPCNPTCKGLHPWPPQEDFQTEVLGLKFGF